MVSRLHGIVILVESGLRRLDAEQAPGTARTESEPLEGVGKGDIDALRELYDRFGAAVYACSTVLACRRGAPPADHLTVTAFTDLWRLGPTLDRDRPLLGALLRLAARAAQPPVAAIPTPVG